MKVKAGEWVVISGAAVIIIFAAFSGVVIYLKPPPVRYIYQENNETIAGEMIYRKEGCGACHEVFGNGTIFGPNLDGVGSRRVAEWLNRYLTAPWPGVSKKRYRLKMPPYGELEPGQMNVLVKYLLALKEIDKNGAILSP